ncbi:MAG TPA: hypothetical protein VG106_10045, partial [Vicinamibacterales bacterium]|nr:hypothetical protein [Vicinamibacterales bacterium]
MATGTVATMSGRAEPPYGERVASWRAILQELEDDFSGEPEFEPIAGEMYRLSRTGDGSVRRERSDDEHAERIRHFTAATNRLRGR